MIDVVRTAHVALKCSTCDRPILQSNCNNWRIAEEAFGVWKTLMQADEFVVYVEPYIRFGQGDFYCCEEKNSPPIGTFHLMSVDIPTHENSDMESAGLFEWLSQLHQNATDSAWIVFSGKELLGCQVAAQLFELGGEWSLVGAVLGQAGSSVEHITRLVDSALRNFDKEKLDEIARNMSIRGRWTVRACELLVPRLNTQSSQAILVPEDASEREKEAVMAVVMEEQISIATMRRELACVQNNLQYLEWVERTQIPRVEKARVIAPYSIERQLGGRLANLAALLKLRSTSLDRLGQSGIGQ